MGKWGNTDFSELKGFSEELKKIENDSARAEFCTECAKELAARLLALVIPRTPVGEYPVSSGKKGGTLRRGWTGGRNSAAAQYAQSLSIAKNGSEYTVEIINPTEYASYVEYGHRTRGGTGWVRGRFFLTMSERELDTIAPAVLQKKLEKYLRESG